MYTLYYMPGACSMAIHVVLNELGQQVTLENVGGDKRPEAFLKINPRGNVPTLVDDGHTIREGGAIIVYLNDKHKGALLPASGFERAAALEWLMFCNATLHPAYGRAFFAMKALKGEEQKNILSLSVSNINKLWQDVEQRLGSSEYLAGNTLTAGDILLTVIANWSAHFPDIKIGENTKRLLREVIARPAYQKALQAEKVEYKVAA